VPLLVLIVFDSQSESSDFFRGCVDVAVPNNGLVRDLKNIIQKKVSGLEQADLGHRHISWQALYFDSRPITSKFHV
jgi:hypothetical protein